MKTVTAIVQFGVQTWGGHLEKKAWHLTGSALPPGQDLRVTWRGPRHWKKKQDEAHEPECRHVVNIDYPNWDKLMTRTLRADVTFSLAQLYRHRFQPSYSSMASLVQNGPTASLAAELQEHAPAVSIANRSVLIPLQQRPAASSAAATQPSSSQKAPSKTAPLQPQSASSALSRGPRAPAPAIAGNNRAKPCPTPGTTRPEYEQRKSQSGDPAARIRTTLSGSRFKNLRMVCTSQDDSQG